MKFNILSVIPAVLHPNRSRLQGHAADRDRSHQERILGQSDHLDDISGDQLQYVKCPIYCTYCLH